MDIVTGDKNEPNSVLLRSLKPVEGIEIMKKKRNKERLIELTTGPGKLIEALSIPFNYDGYDICESYSKIYIVNDGYQITNKNIVRTTRIGISKSKELPNRFYIKNTNFISRK
jgi:DNA-3-methyladenine glycosylase